ncbi:MAG: hypothetical protein DBY38_01995 [Clostridium cadaveris]|uniref:Uncharacterized protein n=1 Tax=Clostridium cadaveris TaxID=1529 RepID=A0A316MC34_9CLOT|nr:hypothetical protein [Clostridium sp.]PWL55368.1 MAG: hypothetical protein DBY38_01995 [Clostridium cadaveris]
MKGIYKIKNLLGICSCKGCLGAADADITINGVDKNTGKEKEIKFSVCVKHAIEIASGMKADKKIKELEIIDNRK